MQPCFTETGTDKWGKLKGDVENTYDQISGSKRRYLRY